ncbi:MAG: DNA polymerase III subunit delta [Deltaproteobacteria bacterium]|nr:DNA polymerase III subunit delta [Deltaproteobacteria bacterium]
MTPDQAIAEADAALTGSGSLRPVYVVVGEEQLLVERVVQALRRGADIERTAGFNLERMIASETSAERVVSAARTVPMMAKRRVILVSGLERWDKDRREDDTKHHPLDVIADYCAAPFDTALLVLSASKINGSRRMMKAAKKGDYLVVCEPLRRHELPPWIARTARSLGHDMAGSAAEALAELCGPELATVADALERLSLYVGPGVRIDEDAIAATITRVRLDDVWALVDAIAARDLKQALATLTDVTSNREEGPRLLGAIGSRVRQLLKYDGARRAGDGPAEAARLAGVVPFKAQDVERTVSRLPKGTLERWLMLMAEADLALKGSRRPGEEVLGTMLTAMCR